MECRVLYDLSLYLGCTVAHSGSPSCSRHMHRYLQHKVDTAEKADHVAALQEARNIEEFGRNFATDPTVKIPWVRRDLCGSKVVVMEWIEGIRCTDINGIRTSGIDIEEFIR